MTDLIIKSNICSRMMFAEREATLHLVSVWLLVEFLWCSLPNQKSLFPKSLYNNAEKCKRTVGFLLVAAAIEPYPLKPNKNLLILIPLPPPPSPIPAALQHRLHSDALILTRAHDLPRSTLNLPLDKCMHPYVPPCVHCSFLLLSNQSWRWVLNAPHAEVPWLNRLLKPDGWDCGEAHP